MMPGDFPMWVIVLVGSCPSNTGDCPWGKLSYRGNGSRRVISWWVIIGGVVALVGSCPEGSCPQGSQGAISC